MQRVLRVALALLALLGLVELAQATERVALVIGNGGYQHANVLANTGNDAQAVAEAQGVIGRKRLRLARQAPQIAFAVVVGQAVAGRVDQQARAPEGGDGRGQVGHGVIPGVCAWCNRWFHTGGRAVAQNAGRTTVSVREI